MNREAWLSVCYTGDFVLMDGVYSWVFDGGIDRGKVIPFPVPRKITYLELYDKLMEKLRFDSSLCEMVLRGYQPTKNNKDPLLTVSYSICDDDGVDWLLSCSGKTRLCVTLKMKTDNDGTMGRNEQGNETNIDIMSEAAGDDAYLLIGDGVGRSVEVEEDEDDMSNRSVEAEEVGDDVAHMGNAEDGSVKTKDVGVRVDAMEYTENGSVEAEDGLGEPPAVGNGDPLLESAGGDAWLANEDHSLTVYGSHSVSWSIPVEEDVKLKDTFDTKDHLKEKLQVLALKHHFEFKTKKSDNGRYIVTCNTEQCMWRLMATSLGASKVFLVRKYQRIHCCPRSLPNRYHKHASSKLIGKFLAPNFQDPSHVSRPKDVMRDFAKEYGYELKYCTTYNAQKCGKELIRGNPLDSYKELPKFFHRLEEQNPGTLTFIQTNDADEFEYCFMALGQSIRGFPSMRQVICVDGTFFKGRKGTLLVATCQDGNYQIYPLAWAVVESESNKSWTWFFEKLKVITGDTRELAIISDRSERIMYGFKQVYKNACHGHCMFHLKRNVKSHFPRLDIDFLFNRAAKAYTVGSFKKHFNALCLKNEGIRDYLDPNNFRYWSRAHFDGLRYNIMTTNIAESLNGLLLNQREFPIVGLLRSICDILQRWFAERRIEANAWGGTLTPKIDSIILGKLDKLVTLNPVVAVIRHPHQFEVCIGGSRRCIVDLEAGKCTCRKFDLHRLPCVHALAAAKKYEMQPGHFCTKYYYTSCWRVAYSESVMPVPDEDEYEYPELVINRKVLPPEWANRRAGRPEIDRKKSAGEAREPGEVRKKRKRRRQSKRKVVVSDNQQEEETLGVGDTVNEHEGTETLTRTPRDKVPGDSGDEMPKKTRRLSDLY